MRHGVVRPLLASALLSLSAAAVAQDNPASRLDLSAGASLWLEEDDGFGFSVSAAFFPFRRLGVVGDAGTYFGLGSSAMAGVKFRFPGAGATPYVQVLIGSAPLDDAALQIGVGVDWRVAPRLALRFAGDLKSAGDDGATYTGVRLSVGVAFGVGEH